MRQSRERDDRHPHAGRADRRRRPRGNGRCDAGPRRGRPRREGAATVSARHEDRRRQGDQAGRVPGRADAGGRARAGPLRARGVDRDRCRGGLGVPRRGRTSASARDRLGRRRLGALRAGAQGEGADRAGVRAAARGADPVHVSAHRGGRAADARAGRERDHRGRLRDGRGRADAAAAGADVRGGRPAGARRRARTSSRSRSAAGGCCSAASRVWLPARS